MVKTKSNYAELKPKIPTYMTLNDGGKEGKKLKKERQKKRGCHKHITLHSIGAWSRLCMVRSRTYSLNTRMSIERHYFYIHISYTYVFSVTPTWSLTASLNFMKKLGQFWKPVGAGEKTCTESLLSIKAFPAPEAAADGGAAGPGTVGARWGAVGRCGVRSVRPSVRKARPERPLSLVCVAEGESRSYKSPLVSGWEGSNTHRAYGRILNAN